MESRRQRYRGVRAQHERLVQRFFGSRRRTLLTLAVVAFIPIVIVQLFYAPTSVLPNVSVGPVALGGMAKQDAAEKLDAAYKEATVPVYFTDSEEVVTEPTLGDLGFTVSNAERVDAYDYPFLARLLPYSLFWYQAVMSKGEPAVAKDDVVFDTYVAERFGEDCEFEPQNATIRYEDEQLKLVPASRGGSCDSAVLRHELAKVNAQLEPARVTVEGTSTSPAVATSVAEDEFKRLKEELADGVTLKVKEETDVVPAETVAPWIEYVANEDGLQLGIASEKLATWLNEQYGEAYNYGAGVTVVTLKDYKEDARESGKNGSSVNADATREQLLKDLKGEQDTATLMIDTIQPKIEYKRTYSPSDAALSAVMNRYADTHAGTYGVKMVELSGDRRNASYNASKVFTTASTYKLFVAYSVLLRIESGEMTWDQPSYGGLSVSTCFDRMIELSNNECSVWFLLRISYDTVTKEAHALGATNTNFVRSSGISSTAEDEAHFLSLLYTGQMLEKQESRDRLIAAMKGNVYVSGIPSGIPNATVADKVGFLDGLLHDAAIVYSPKGHYVLIILTDNASWGNIAELAGEIEAAR